MKVQLFIRLCESVLIINRVIKLRAGLVLNRVCILRVFVS